jgi:hypothetical protein
VIDRDAVKREMLRTSRGTLQPEKHTRRLALVSMNLPGSTSLIVLLPVPTGKMSGFDD